MTTKFLDGLRWILRFDFAKDFFNLIETVPFYISSPSPPQNIPGQYLNYVNTASFQNILKFLIHLSTHNWGVRGSVVEWGAMLQAEMSRVRFPMT
jgi:hypothetical protein